MLKVVVDCELQIERNMIREASACQLETHVGSLDIYIHVDLKTLL